MEYFKIVLQKGQSAYFTSDTHWHHYNICRGTSNWKVEDHGDESIRDFDSIEQMNKTISDGINNIVQEDDWLIHLGDWSFAGIHNIWNFRKEIQCKNIILVLGNHDHHISKNKEIPAKDIPPIRYRFKDGTYKDYSWHTRSLFTAVYSNLLLSITDLNNDNNLNLKRSYFLSHFPNVVWDKAHHGRIHLFGHVHGSYTHPSRALDVGIDNAYKMFGQYRPFTEQEIQHYMKDRKYVQVSHHNVNTN